MTCSLSSFSKSVTRASKVLYTSMPVCLPEAPWPALDRVSALADAVGGSLLLELPLRFRPLKIRSVKVGCALKDKLEAPSFVGVALALPNFLNMGMVRLPLEPESVDRLFRFLRIVKGWSLGIRLTGSAVTVRVEGAFSGYNQVRRASDACSDSKSKSLGQISSGALQMSVEISLIMSSKGPHTLSQSARGEEDGRRIRRYTDARRVFFVMWSGEGQRST